MSLVESMPWQSKIIDAPPVKLGYRDLAIPEGVQLTFIAAAHSSPFGLPDYLKEIFPETDLFMPELINWDRATAKRLQRMANGDFKALQKILEMNAMEIGGQVAEWSEVMYKALFRSGIRVALVDYPEHHPGAALLDKIFAEGMTMTKRTMPSILDRDKFILNRIVAELTQLRQNPDFAHKDTIRGLALFGVGHFAIHDGFAAAITEGTEGQVASSSRLLFEQGADFPPYDAYGVSKESLESSRDGIVDYQNWLRTQD